MRLQVAVTFRGTKRGKNGYIGLSILRLYLDVQTDFCFPDKMQELVTRLLWL
jgi:hypothetical protein